MSKRLFLIPAALILLAAGFFAFVPAATAQNENIRVRVERVPVLFTAFDHKERLITDLGRDEIKVFDNKKPQEIVDFVKETDLPLRIGLVIDTSNSIRDRFKFEQESAIEFLHSVLRHQRDKAFVLAFDTNTEVVQDFTADFDQLSKGVRSLRAGGGTALYDAVYYAARDKMMSEDPEGGVRRTLVLLSDGDDNASRASREDALAMAQRGEVTIFAISTNSSRQEMPGDKVLRHFAEETGGRVFFPFKPSDLTSSFERISEELRSQYALLYKPSTPRDGTFHSIEVQTVRKGVKIRARKGYFAARE